MSRIIEQCSTRAYRRGVNSQIEECQSSFENLSIYLLIHMQFVVKFSDQIFESSLRIELNADRIQLCQFHEQLVYRS